MRWWLRTFRSAPAWVLLLVLLGCEEPKPDNPEPPAQRTFVVSGKPASDRFVDALGGNVRAFTLPSASDAELSTQADALSALLRDADGTLTVVATGSGREVALLGMARSGLDFQRLVLLDAPDDELPGPLFEMIGTVHRISADRPGSDADIIVGNGFGYIHSAVARRIADMEDSFGPPIILTGQPAGPGWQLTRVTVEGAGWVQIGDWQSEIGHATSFTPYLNVPGGTQLPVTPYRVRRLRTDVELANATVDVGEDEPVSEVSGDGWRVSFEWRPVVFH
ncbi:MAG: hypothetical protein AAGD32_14130 [Planctomycetota bacterium]